MISSLLSTAKQFQNDLFKQSLYNTLNHIDCTNILSEGVRDYKDAPAKFCKATANVLLEQSKSFDQDMIDELNELSKVKVTQQQLPPLPEYVDKKSEFFVYLSYNYFTCLISYITDIYSIEEDDDIAYHSLYTFMGSLDDFINQKEYEYGGKKPDYIIKVYFILCLYATQRIIASNMMRVIDFCILTDAEIRHKMNPGYDLGEYGYPKIEEQLKSYKEENLDIFYAPHSISKPEPHSTKQDTVEPNSASTFTPIKDDFRETKKGVPNYKDLIKNPSRFAVFEQRIFDEEYIDEKLKFLGRRGTINEMAMLIHILIRKNYFKNFNDSLLRPITEKHIEKFFSHRYNQTFDKRFRFYSDNPTAIANFEEKTLWLRKIPSC